MDIAISNSTLLLEILRQRAKINYVKLLGICGYTKFTSHSNRLDLMTNGTFISNLSRIRINFSNFFIISIYLASNLVFDLIQLHTDLDILYTSQHKTD